MSNVGFDKRLRSVYNSRMDDNQNNENKNEKNGYTPMSETQLRHARKISTIISVVAAAVVLVIYYLKKNGVF